MIRRLGEARSLISTLNDRESMCENLVDLMHGSGRSLR